VSAVSTADTASVDVSVVAAGVGVSVATSTATSNATAIDLGGGDDTVVNMNGGQTGRTGKLVADATANAIAASVTVTPAGVAIASDAVWRGGTTATAGAAGIDAGPGKDIVVNAAEMDIDSTARTGAVSAAVTVFGVSAALVNSTATATGAGIKTGDNVRDDDGKAIDTDLASEADSVFNSGRLVVDVDALATSLGVGFAFGGVTGTANSLWDGGTAANAFAWGIGLGNGADDLTNSGIVDIASFANAVSASFGITVFGVSAAVVDSHSECPLVGAGRRRRQRHHYESRGRDADLGCHGDRRGGERLVCPHRRHRGRRHRLERRHEGRRRGQRHRWGVRQRHDHERRNDRGESRRDG
jgi:hypothetical protein